VVIILKRSAYDITEEVIILKKVVMNCTEEVIILNGSGFELY